MTFDTKADTDNLSDVEYMRSLDEDCRLWLKRFPRAGEQTGSTGTIDTFTLTPSDAPDYILLAAYLSVETKGTGTFRIYCPPPTETLMAIGCSGGVYQTSTAKRCIWRNPTDYVETTTTGYDGLMYDGTQVFLVNHSANSVYSRSVVLDVYYLDKGTQV